MGFRGRRGEEKGTEPNLSSGKAVLSPHDQENGDHAPRYGDVEIWRKDEARRRREKMMKRRKKKRRGVPMRVATELGDIQFFSLVGFFLPSFSSYREP